ncbi:hypothetical protein R1sor_023902 [Riccia sorocarpa]|uniref:Reverse transcriptase domain-containing protein n=1 Tax=Riccia sorocarpa TaxID=122646 RepID=A0ABD3GQI2_9MARC
MCNEAVFQAKTRGQDSILLKIDFRKEFDTIKWDFLYVAMRKMGFGDTFISFITALNNNATSSVRLNNTSSKSFQTSRSVRHGCPLSPLLFTIAIQVLTDVINDMLLTNELKGIDLAPIGIQYCQGFYADDSHLLLAADRQNLLNAKNLLQSFGPNARLKNAGIEDIGDISQDGRTILPLHLAVAPYIQISAIDNRAYDRITLSTPIHTASYRCSSKFLVSPPTNPTTAMRKKSPDRFLLSCQDKDSIVASLQWKDQSGFLEAPPNANIRRIATADSQITDSGSGLSPITC